MKILLAGSILIAVTIAACSTSSESPSDIASLKKTADIAAIDQIEVTWHKAATTKNVDLFMSLWADDAVWTVGGRNLIGKAQIRNFVVRTAAPFQLANHWISETPAYKIRTTVHEGRGTLYFECHYADIKTRQIKVVIALDGKVARIKGHWLLTNAVNGAASLN